MTLKQKALAHYDRMIAWAEKQPKRKMADGWGAMLLEIGENYYGKYCVYCRKHFRKSKCSLGSDVTCQSGDACCGGLWVEMYCSLTWGTWVKRARKVREYIEKNG